MKRKVLLITILIGVLSLSIIFKKEDNKLIKENIKSDNKKIAVNISEDGTNYTNADEIPTTGYSLNTEKSMCKVATNSIASAPKDNNITIEYTDGKINFLGVTKQSTRCYLYFDKYEPTASDTILANITPKDTTPDFSKSATTDEGVYAVSDGMYGGTSYYWRGAVTNNYVEFANFCWRIIRINGDGSIRLIYDGTTCHANGTNTTESIAKSNIAYNSRDNQSNYVGWTYEGELQRPTDNTTATPSNAKTQLESWYSSNITGTNASKVADGKYCNDRDVGSEYTWEIKPSSTFYYAAYKRITVDYSPSLACSSGDVYTLNVGLITADEAMYAGGISSITNYNYYLYNGQNYLTMSPYDCRDGNNYARVHAVGDNGLISATKYSLGNVSYGLRPVINLNLDVTFSGGNGTQSDPYVVS